MGGLVGGFGFVEEGFELGWRDVVGKDECEEEEENEEEEEGTPEGPPLYPL